MTKTELPEKIEFYASLDMVKTIMDKALIQSDGMVFDMMRHLTVAGGKNFRAMLLLAAASDQDGFVKKNALISAAALEILHLATLVHDDVIDDAETRRGQQSVQSKFGKKSAVICGDYLFCKCFSLVAEMSAEYQSTFSDIARAMSKICLGELRQFKHNRDTALTARDYFKIIAGKTSALFSLALYSGGVIGGYEKTEARLLARFGYYIGMIFQLDDDCIDYETDSKTAKKSVKHDLAEGVVTLPLIYAIYKRPQLREAIKNASLTPSELNEIVSEVSALGGVTMTRNVAEKYYFKAQKVLDCIKDVKRRALFTSILNKIQSREY